ncbi:MAG: DUF1801 domain-containing protein [Bacteroidota bacterium]
MSNYNMHSLNYLRELIRSTCLADIKWGTPQNSYKGENIFMMGGFKNHCTFSLYKVEMMKDKAIQDIVKAGNSGLANVAIQCFVSQIFV